MHETSASQYSDERPSTPHMVLPKELKALYIELAEVLREKVQALQDHKYDVAATLRDREQRLRDQIADFKEH